MKTLIKKLAIILMAAIAFNCSNSDDAVATTQEFSPQLLNGTWRIGLFQDETQNRTAEFNGYEFMFNIEKARVTITYKGVSKVATINVYKEAGLAEGTWVVYTGFDAADNPGTADLNDLVEDWFVTKVNANATRIEFKELYSNNTPEILQLVKISDLS